MSLMDGSKKAGFSGINVTPLTDVMLVLLITFLLSASSFEDSQLVVPLPQVQESKEIEKYSLLVQVREDGTIDWPEQALSGLSTEEALKKLLSEQDKRILALAVHRACPYSKFFPIAEAAAKAGWPQVVLLTTEST